MPRESAIVKGSEGPLDEREEEDFERIGFEIGTKPGKREK